MHSCTEASTAAFFALVYNFVGSIDGGNSYVKLVCGRRVFEPESLNLLLGQGNLFVVPLVYGTDTTFQINCLGYF